MRIFDAHCDALLKLWEDPAKEYTDDPAIEANAVRLMEGGVRAQCFAIFVEPDIPFDQKFQVALQQAELFHEKILKKHPQFTFIERWDDLLTLDDDQIGAILTLEGADPFGDDPTKLKTLYRLGVRSLGLTWNQANLCADGVGEPRGGGLTEWGKAVVSLNNEHHVLTDVSHLSERGFWDVIEYAQFPVATHSNAKAICDLRRNLTDAQLKALIEAGGFIGIVFHPHFLTGTDDASIDDVMKHIEHICSLGGQKHVGFGSDFDGIPCFVDGLEHAGRFQWFMDELLKRYDEELVRGFAWDNFLKATPISYV